MSEGPLSGFTIVEIGNLVAAPYAAMLLGDLGARVIKVEPLNGDLGRAFGPFQEGESVFFMSVNRGKESVALDTKDPDSRRALMNLAAEADALIHNLRHGAIERIGLGFEQCMEINDDIIHVTISAFGSDGPYAGRPGIDIVFQGESGMVSITGGPEDAPAKTATTIGDYVAGTNAALAVAAALAETPRRARRIDVSLRDGAMAVQSGWNALHFASGSQPERTGTASPYLAPNQVFEASDEPFTLAIVSDGHFEILCDAISIPELFERYPTNRDRIDHRNAVADALHEVFRREPAAHWLELIGDAGLPCGRILTLAEAFDDPQAVHNEMLVAFDHPVAGRVQTTGSPIRVDRAPARSNIAPPLLGQDTHRLLVELGLDEETVDQMLADGRAVSNAG